MVTFIITILFLKCFNNVILNKYNRNYQLELCMGKTFFVILLCVISISKDNISVYMLYFTFSILNIIFYFRKKKYINILWSYCFIETCLVCPLRCHVTSPRIGYSLGPPNPCCVIYYLFAHIYIRTVVKVDGFLHWFTNNFICYWLTAN